MKLVTELMGAPDADGLLLPSDKPIVKPESIRLDKLEKAKFDSDWWSRSKAIFVGAFRDSVVSFPSILGNTAHLLAKEKDPEDMSPYEKLTTDILNISNSWTPGIQSINEVTKPLKLITQGATAIGKMFNEEFDMDIDDITKNVRKSIAEWGDQLSDDNRAWVEEHFPVPIDDTTRVLQDIGGGLASVGTSMTLAYFTKSPLAVLAYFGTIEAGSKFKELIDAGVDINISKLGAILSGIAEGSLESASTFLVMNATLPWLARGGLGAVTEGLEEFSQSISSDTFSYLFGGKEFEGWNSVEEMLGTATYSGAIGLIVGGPGGFYSARLQRNNIAKIYQALGETESQAKIKANELIKTTTTQMLEEMETQLFGQMVKEKRIAIDALTGRKLTPEALTTLEEMFKKRVDNGMITGKSAETLTPSLMATAIEESDRVIDKAKNANEVTSVDINDVVARADEITESVLRQRDTETALRKVEGLASRLGVNMKIRYSDEYRPLDWDNPEDQIYLKAHGYTKEKYDERKKQGSQPYTAGLHTAHTGGDGKQWSDIKLFRGFSALDIYHEFGHALDKQGKVLNREEFGSDEDFAETIEKILSARDSEVSEATEEGQRINDNLDKAPEIATDDNPITLRGDGVTIRLGAGAEVIGEPFKLKDKMDAEEQTSEASVRETSLTEEAKKYKVEEIKVSDTPERARAVGLEKGKWDAMSKDIKENGVKVPIIIDKESGMVLDGHTRLTIAESLGIEKVPVIYVNKDNMSKKDVDNLNKGLTDIWNKAQQPQSIDDSISSQEASVRETIPRIPSEQFDGDLPIFKNTNEALDFGEKATLEQAKGMQYRRIELLDEIKAIKDQMDPDGENMDLLQKGMDLAVEAQLYREAIEAYNDKRVGKDHNVNKLVVRKNAPELRFQFDQGSKRIIKDIKDAEKHINKMTKKKKGEKLSPRDKYRNATKKGKAKFIEENFLIDPETEFEGKSVMWRDGELMSRKMRSNEVDLIQDDNGEYWFVAKGKDADKIPAYKISMADGKITLFNEGNIKVKSYILDMPAIWTCQNCKTCAGSCYAVGAQVQYVASKLGRWGNFYMFMNYRSKFRELLDEQLTRQEFDVVRLHSSGDIWSKKYFEFLENLVIDHPKLKFYLYSKTGYDFSKLDSLDNFNKISSILPDGNKNYGDADFVKDMYEKFKDTHKISTCPASEQLWQKNHEGKTFTEKDEVKCGLDSFNTRKDGKPKAKQYNMCSKCIKGHDYMLFWEHGVPQRDVAEGIYDEARDVMRRNQASVRESEDIRDTTYAENIDVNKRTQVRQPFYTQTERAFRDSPQTKFTKEQALALIKKKGKKADVDQAWMETYLETYPEKTITKEKILQVLDDVKNGFEVITAEGYPTDPNIKLWEDWARREHPEGKDIKVERRSPSVTQHYYDVYVDGEIVMEGGGDSKKFFNQPNTKWEGQTLSGGENYREYKFSLPSEYDEGVANMKEEYNRILEIPIENRSREHQARFERLGDELEILSEDALRYDDFKSHAFDEKNVFAWLRVKTRETVDGLKAFFVEESQKVNPNVDTISEEQFRNLPSFARADNTLFMVKQMIEQAIQSDADIVAWTTGDQQVDRYKDQITETIDKVSWGRMSDRVKEVYVYLAGKLQPTELFVDQEGRVAEIGDDSAEIREKVKGKLLSQVVGKDIAKQIMDNENGDVDSVDFKIGGDDLRSFYDKSLPKIAEKYIKKLDPDAKVEKFNLDEEWGSDFSLNAVEAITLSKKGRILLVEVSDTEFDIISGEQEIQEAIDNGKKMYDTGMSDNWTTTPSLDANGNVQVGEHDIMMGDDVIETNIIGNTGDEALERYENIRIRRSIDEVNEEKRGKLKQKEKEVGEQPGFRITDTMKTKVMEEGQALASVRERNAMNRSDRYQAMEEDIANILALKIDYKEKKDALKNIIKDIEAELDPYKKNIALSPTGQYTDEWDKLRRGFQNKENGDVTIDQATKEAGFGEDINAFVQYLNDMTDTITMTKEEIEAITDREDTFTRKKIVKDELAYLKQRITDYKQGKKEGVKELQEIQTRLRRIAQKVLPQSIRGKAIGLIDKVNDKNYAKSLAKIENLYQEYQLWLARGKAVSQILDGYKHPENIFDIEYQDKIDKMREKLGDTKAERTKRIKDMSTDDLIKLARRIALFQEKGRASLKQKKANMAMAREIIRASLIKASGGVVDATGIVGGEKEKGLKEKGSKLRWELTRPIRMLKRIFGDVGIKYLYDPLDYWDTLENLGVFERTNSIDESGKKYGVTRMMLGETITVDGETLQVNDILTMYAQRGNEKGLSALLNGNKIPEATYNKFLYELEQKYPNIFKFADDVIAVVDSRYEKLRRVMKDVYNIDLKKEANYFPMFRTDYIKSTDEENSLAFDIISDADIRTNGGVDYTKVKDSFKFDRVNINPENQTALSMDFMGSAIRAIQMQEHFINFAYAQKMTNSLISDKALKNSITYNHGKKAWETFNEYLKNAINPATTLQKMDTISKRVRVYRKSKGVMYLAYNLVTASKAFFSLPLVLRDTSMSQLVKSTYKILTDEKARDAIFKKDPLLKVRTVSRDFKDFMKKHSHLSSNDILRRLQILEDDVGTNAFWLILNADKLAVLSAYDAVYEHQKKTMSENESKDIAHKAVLETQPQGRNIDLPEMYRTNNEWLRLALQFSNQLNQIWNMMTEDNIEMWKRMHNMENVKDKAEIKKRMMTNMASIMLSSFLITLASHGFKVPDDEEEQAMFVLEALLGSFIASVPIIGNVGMSLARGYSPSIGGTDDFFKDLKRIKRKWKNEEYFEAMTEGAMITAILGGVITGNEIKVPYSVPKKAMEGLFDLADGETSDPRRIIYSKSALYEYD